MSLREHVLALALLLGLGLPLVCEEVAPIRQGIDRDGVRVLTTIVLPDLPAPQRERLTSLCVASIPGIEPGMDLAGHVRNTHATLLDALIRLKQQDPTAASLSGWCEESLIRTTWSGGGLISLHGKHFGFSGGAHPWLKLVVQVVDAKTLTLLTLDDLIAPADQPLFSELLTDRWRQDAHLAADALPSKHGLFVDQLPPVIPLITADGIEALYSPYEVGPWSTGTVRVALTREQARPFLRRDPWGK